jgi:hypothetical protein
MSSLIRDLARRALGITRLGRDIRLLADALIALDRRADEIEARLGEFIVGEPAERWRS